MASQGTLNKVMLIGHTGDDVKMHYFDNGGCVGNFPLATNESYVNKSTGQQVTNTEWHNIVVRNKAAEICERFLKKGDKVYIEGRIRTRKYQDSNGIDRYITEILATDFTFLTPKGESGKHSGGTDQKASDKPASYTKTDAGKANTDAPDIDDEEEDDLPF